jgi:hypothetical protein
VAQGSQTGVRREARRWWNSRNDGWNRQWTITEAGLGFPVGGLEAEVGVDEKEFFTS